MITLDGSLGEGGGQIVRSSLALSLITKTPIKIVNIRAGRRKPGLMRQHLTSVRAAAEVGQAEVRGDAIGSRQVTFEPHNLRHGTFQFSIGTAGSCGLVLQTVLPALLMANGPSTMTLRGGTHNPFAPPFEFLDKAFVPVINRMGARVSMRLHQPGFYPNGGGMMTVQIEPIGRLNPIELIERGRIASRKAIARIARLPEDIARRELDVVAQTLGWPRNVLNIERSNRGPGNALILEAGNKNVTEIFTGFGKKGVPAESVAKKACEAVTTYLEADVPIGPHLADQLLIPFAMASGGRFRTLPPTQHTQTNMEVIKRFLSVQFDVVQIQENVCEIAVRQ